MKLTKQQFNQLLSRFPCEATFIKKDNSIRVMQCTLMLSELPPIVESEEKSDKSKKEVPEHQIRVYDTEAKAWRSFDVNSLITFKVNGVTWINNINEDGEIKI